MLQSIEVSINKRRIYSQNVCQRQIKISIRELLAPEKPS